MTTPQFIGADPAQLDDLAVRMGQAADELDRIRGSVHQRLASSSWAGHDAEQFRHDWYGRHSARLKTAAAATREAARLLRHNAVQQRDASGESGGSAIPWGRAPGGGALTTLPGALRDWLDGARTLVGGGQALIWAGDLVSNVGNDVRLLGNLGDLRRLADFAGPFQVGPLDGIALGFDVSRLAAEIANGDVQLSTVFATVWDAASLYPPIGLLTGAWDTGAFIGEQTANFLQEHTGYQDAIYDSIVADRYDGPLTPAQADELVQRYSGWAGPLHMTGDLVTSELHSVGDGVRSLFDKIF